tara:strand:- start:293 stop:1384 length:1092 start_codon:yes stop_codon:yes gene_type:complete
MLIKIIKLINFKIFWKEPKPKKVLVYDRFSLKFAETLFKKNDLSIYDVRNESINFAILFKTIFKNGFNSIKKNYKFEYFKSVKPKIVYTSIDNNLGFYQLKKVYPQAIYVADQNGMRDNKFYEQCKNFYKSSFNQKLYTDLFFCFGNNEKNRLRKVIKGKIVPLGNSLNNKLKIKKEKNKINKIIFVSGSSNEKTKLQNEIKVFKYLKKICDNENLKLSFLDKPNKKRKKILEKKINFKFHYIMSGNLKKKQKFLKPSTLFVFKYSTFGYEILSTGIRCVCLNHKKLSHGFKKYKNSGPFWLDAPSYNYKYVLIEKVIKKVLNYKKSEWIKIYKFFSSQIMVYDNNNKKKIKIIQLFTKVKHG